MYTNIILWFASVALLILISIWMWIGAWKSATRYISHANTSTPKTGSFWGYAAQATILMGVLASFVTYTPLIIDISALYQQRHSAINTLYNVEIAGETDVVLTGYINESSINTVIVNFESNDKLTNLIINSSGGFIDAAFDLSDFIETNNISVMVDQNCLSACLLLLTSSENTYVTPTSKLAFHHPEDTVNITSPDLKAELDKLNAEYYERFHRFGIDDETLQQFKSAGWTDLTIGDALRLKLVRYLWEPKANKITDLEEYCENIDCFNLPAQAQIDPNISIAEIQAFAAETVNLRLPAKIDEVTTLEYVSTEQEILIYHYRIAVNISEIDKQYFVDTMNEQLIRDGCSQNDMIEIMNKGGGYRYSYTSLDEVFITEIQIDGNVCNNTLL